MRILLVAYDNDMYINPFPHGLAYIAGVLLKKGYEITIYNQDKLHYPDHHLTEYLNRDKYDIIGVGVVAGYYQYRKLLKISEAINRSKNRPFYILGGHGPSPEPAFFLKKTRADAVVMGEGEATIVELAEAIANKKSFSIIKGIAYLEGEKVVINKRRPLIQDIDTIPFPAYELFPIDYYRLIRAPHAMNSDFVMPLLSGRGCTFKCNFCYRMDEGFRPRNNESIIEEIKYLKKVYGITYIDFTDELLMSSISKVVSLCNDFIKNKLDMKWDCNGRLNYAKPDVLRLMKKAGCVFINYGIESVDNQVLKNMNKALTVKQAIDGIKATLESGISPGFNIIFGNIGDNRKTLSKSVEFLLKYDDHSQLRTIRPVTPYPGSPLYYHALENGMLKDVEEFYETKHINSDLVAVNFTDLTDEEFHKCLYEANSRLLENYSRHRLEDYIRMTKKLYFEKDAAFRGFRQT